MRCAACDRRLTDEEVAMQDRFFHQDDNDLCRTCRAIVGDPDNADKFKDSLDHLFFEQDKGHE
jgi:hypothetical protein